MQKNALVVIALVLFSGFAMSVSDEESTGASVTVNSYVSITLTDNGDAGINFGSLDPAQSDIPEAAQTDSVGAVAVTNDTISNTDVNVYVKGADFSGAGTIAASSVTYNDTNSHADELILANAYGTALETGVARDNSVNVWFWLDVPSGQTAGVYNSTFSFKGDTA